MMCLQLSGGFHMAWRAPHFDRPEGVHDMPAPVRWVLPCCCLTARNAAIAVTSLKCQLGIVNQMHMLYAWLQAQTITCCEISRVGSKAVADFAVWESSLALIECACHASASCWLSMAYVLGSHVVKVRGPAMTLTAVPLQGLRAGRPL